VLPGRRKTAERIVLASRPVGEPTLHNFRLEEFPIPQPGPGQILLRTLWLSLDPYMRGRMSDAPSYAKPVGIGDVMEGGTVSEVVASNVPRVAKGNIVVGRTGWQTYALSALSWPVVSVRPASIDTLAKPMTSRLTGTQMVKEESVGKYLR
jgi:NADPH-dependent curcumin reductase CurA